MPMPPEALEVVRSSAKKRSIEYNVLEYLEEYYEHIWNNNIFLASKKGPFLRKAIPGIQLGIFKEISYGLYEVRKKYYPETLLFSDLKKESCGTK